MRYFKAANAEQMRGVSIQQNNHWVKLWLASIFVFVALIVFVGGVTRLTHSGLSMVDWNPIMGVIPPLNESQWQETFLEYQKFPEYQVKNQQMDLAGFKRIFFWEYFHRILGRTVGILFFIPWAFFLFKGWISRKFAGLTLIGFVLGGMQGLLGWYMVKSGLIQRPSVSHFRLAAHLSLALVIYSYFFWLWLDFGKTSNPQKANPKTRPLRMAALGLSALVAVQIVYGAFVAGLRAGKIYNTFPKMNGHWFPAEGLALTPLWNNWINNMATIQFTHRSLAWVIIVYLCGLIIYTKKNGQLHQIQKPLSWIVGALGLQFYLGVYTLLFQVPIWLGSLHQLGAIFLLSATLYLNFKLFNHSSTYSE